MTHPVQNLQMAVPTERWEVAEPPAGSIFLAQRRGAFEYFRPNITVSVTQLLPEESLTDVAASLLAGLRRMDADASADTDLSALPDRVMQRGLFTLYADGHPPLRLAQWQVIVAMPAQGDGPTFALSLVLGAEADTIQQYGPDFQSLIGSATTTEEPRA